MTRNNSHIVSRRSTITWALGALMALTSSQALAQAFPSKPIRIVVGFGAGSLPDSFARKIGEGLSRRLGQPVIIENRVGGNGIIATQNVSSSPPDGYTLSFGALQPPLVTHQSMYKKLPYDPVNGYTPVALLCEIPLALTVRADSKFNSANDYIKFARANPGSLTFGSPGVAMPATLGAHLFAEKLGFSWTQIPYQGSTPAVQALLAGEVDTVFTDIATTASHVRAGKLRLLATATSKRVAQFPDVPTLAESGFTDISIPPIWMGFVGPPNMPVALVVKLNEEINRVASEPELQAMLDKWVLTPLMGKPELMEAQIKADRATWPPLVKRLGITLE